MNLNPGESSILGLIRHSLTVAGTFLATSGYFDGGQVEGIVGAIMTLIGVGWSVVEKQQTAAKIDAALSAPANSTRDSI